MRIVLITGAHACRNPRVVKEADALSEAGFEVTVLRPVLQDALEAEDRALQEGRDWRVEHTVDLRQTVQGLQARITRRMGGMVTQWEWERPEALGYGMHTTLRQARKLQADLYIGHQEVGSWVVWRLLQEGFRVGADIEDWYSRDLLPEARAGRPLRLLQRVEGDLLRHAPHVTITSHVMAEAMATAYRAPKPTVVYNAFPWSDRVALEDDSNDKTRDREPTDERPSLHWVSQTIGPGRGLETLCQALQRVDTPVQVHLRGQCGPAYREQLNLMFPYDRGHTFTLHELVPPEDLLARISEHDIGLALEEYTPESRHLTVTNKVLHYILGGLAVVATDTAGQKEVARQAPEAVRLCAADNPSELARAITVLVRNREELHRAKQSAIEAAQHTFCWEQQAPRLVSSVERALSGMTARRSAP